MNGRPLNTAKWKAIHADYMKGLSLMEVGKLHGLSQEAVRGGFVRCGLPRKKQGGCQEISTFPDNPRPTRSMSIAWNPPPPAKQIWCLQCDRRVTAEQAESCRSRFCKAKAVAA